MRTFLLGVALFALLAGGIVGGWVAMNRLAVGSVGAPAHAGAVSNGHPEACTNVNFQVGSRSESVRTIMLEEGDLLRGTFEADGGFGKVDIIMRIFDPQGNHLTSSPRVANYDFVLPVKLRGEYKFVFDNRYSIFTAKAVGLFYCIDNGRP